MTMRIMFVHQNFPGQFLHLAPEMAKRGHHVIALTADSNLRPPVVPTIKYRWTSKEFPRSEFGPGATYSEQAHRGESVAAAADYLRKKSGYYPDVVVGHPGWGESLYLREVWPNARHIAYAEFFYGTRGLDTDFDSEFPFQDLSQRIWVTSRQAAQLQALASATQLWSPTFWQKSTFPSQLQSSISVIHDGINTEILHPMEAVQVELPGGLRFDGNDEVVTFISRNLEPYRGYHIFMRALPKVLLSRPDAHVVIVGGDGCSYGPRPASGRSWKDIFFEEVKHRLDLKRVHFVGQIPYPSFVNLLRVTRVHAYLTYPFVLSWSMLEAMSLGCLVVGSRTPPVEEVLVDGVNGRLVDFFAIEEWSDALIEALARYRELGALRQAARETISARFDLRRICLPKQIQLVETSLV